MSFPLADDRIRELYATFPRYDEWCGRLVTTTEWFRSLGDAEKRDPANQERLWTDGQIATVGRWGQIDVSHAYRSAPIVEKLVSLRSLAEASSVGERSAALQREYDSILSMLTSLRAGPRPMALLSRVFAVLIPEHTHTVFRYAVNIELGRRVLSERPSSHVALRVAVRQRLRVVLGEEADLEEHALRVTFCWWLASLDRSDLERPLPTDAMAAPTPTADDAEPALELWSFTKQYKGWVSVPGFVETYRQVVRETEGGAEPDEVVTALEDALGLRSPAKRYRNLISRVRRLGFIERRDGALWPTDEGHALVDDDPPAVLISKLLMRVYGLARLLRLASDGPVHTNVIYEAIMAEYRNWTTPAAPSHLRSWLKALGLITVENAEVCITEMGRYWLDRLPAELPSPPPGYFDDAVDEEEEEARETRPAEGARRGLEPSIRDIRAHMLAAEEMKTFVLDDTHVAALHAAWHANETKRFAIFSGLSGTGKTALMLQYARSYCKLSGVPEAEHIALVAVSPDWRDPTGLLGYFNALHADPTYQAQAATRLLVRAARNPELPYFLLLDEMNLARVERYLAPLLSAMESKAAITLHAHDEPVNGVPPRIRWPARLFIGGTVNMDESTHGFSDKVLDRAFTLESWDVDLNAYFERRARAGNARQVAVESALISLHDQLVTCRRHFGYRSADEVLRFVERATSDGMLSETDALDASVFSKVLPRLRGTELDGLHDVLEGVQGLLKSRGLSRSEAKVATMLNTLKRTGVTRFFA